MKNFFIASILGVTALSGCSMGSDFSSDKVATEEGYPALASKMADTAVSNDCMMNAAQIAGVFVAEGVEEGQIERVMVGMVVNQQIEIVGEDIRVTHGVCA